MMKLYFANAELLLQSVNGEFVLEMAGKEIGRFKREKQAITAYNQIRRELEMKMPPARSTKEEGERLLREHLAESLVGHNSWLTPQKKTAKSRVHHT